jgi:hypothetical protein
MLFFFAAAGGAGIVGSDCHYLSTLITGMAAAGSSVMQG